MESERIFNLRAKAAKNSELFFYFSERMWWKADRRAGASFPISFARPFRSILSVSSLLLRRGTEAGGAVKIV